MKVTFIGATHEVTGSCTLIEVGGHRLLVDCGMEQGRDIFENQEIPVNPGDIELVLLTHAHVDHSGNLPLLYKNGFRGSIYATGATCNLCNIMLRDCAHIQEYEAQWRNRKAKRSGGKPYEPLFDMQDAEGAISKLRPCEYDRDIQVCEGVTVCFRHVGHLLGASSIEITLTEGDVTKKIVFSGDIGNRYQPIICDNKTVTDADYVVIESTYGNRLHDGAAATIDHAAELAAHLQRTFDRGGSVVIPSFAVGRTQELLYHIRKIKDEGLVKGHDGFPVYMDSPLANEATAVFLQCDEVYLDEQTQALLDEGINPIFFEGLVTAVSADESKAINFDNRPKVIISASGMCEAGRVRHHLKHNLWRKECTVLFAGYQSEGTLGRMLIEGAERVKLFGEDIEVNAEIAVLRGTSGHGDRDMLVDWLQGFENKPGVVFVNHGDDESCTSFAALLHEQYGYETIAPYSGTIYDLATGTMCEQTDGVVIERKKNQSTNKKSQAAYSRLRNAGEQLMSIIRSSEGIANKELINMAVQIENLCNRFKDDK